MYVSKTSRRMFLRRQKDLQSTRARRRWRTNWRPARITCAGGLRRAGPPFKNWSAVTETIMRAWLLDDLNGIERLRLADVDEPILRPGEAIVELSYAALNPADRYLAEKQYPGKPPLPHILGRDGIGRVIQVDSGTEDIRIGDKRAILRG